MDKKLFTALAFAYKTLDYEKDPDPENWRTIKGAHVHVDNEGKIDGGAGGKFNGRGALPRSLFPGQGKAKQTEFAEVTAKRKENEEAAKKAAEAAKVKRKKERAAAQKAKREEKRKLENERPRLKQKFNDLRESYHKEMDVKKKKGIIKQLKEIESEYKAKFGKHPDDDSIKFPEKKAKPAGNKVVRVKLSNGVILRWQAVPGEPDKVYNPETHEMYDFKGGLKAALEKAKSQGAEIEEYEETPGDPYANETTSRETRRGARGAAATRRASKRGRPPGSR